jgi:hypothetical protein
MNREAAALHVVAPPVITVPLAVPDRELASSSPNAAHAQQSGTATDATAAPASDLTSASTARVSAVTNAAAAPASNATSASKVPAVTDAIASNPASSTALVPANSATASTALIVAPSTALTRETALAKALVVVEGARVNTTKADLKPLPVGRLVLGPMTTLASALGLVSSVTGYDPSILGAAVAGAGVVGFGAITLNAYYQRIVSPFKRRRAAREQARALDAVAKSTLIEAPQMLSGLERAWLAQRAASVIKGMEGFDAKRYREMLSKPMLKQLHAAADETGIPIDDNHRTAVAMRSIFDRVHGDDFRDEIEAVIADIEKLSPEARNLLAPSVRQSAAAVLRDDAQRWRAKRFDEALDGQRSDYTSISTEFQPSTPRADVVGPPSPDDLFNTKVLELSGKVAISNAGNRALSVDTTVGHTATAEKVASYFERLGYRCALTGLERGVRVRIYDPSVG